MRAALTAPFADVRAADFVLELDGPEAPALQTLVLALEGLQLELRLLGHSHQAIVTAPDFRLAETVSCRGDAGDDGHLPAVRAVRRDGRAYAFSAEVLSLEELDPGALMAAVAEDPGGLSASSRGRPVRLPRCAAPSYRSPAPPASAGRRGTPIRRRMSSSARPARCSGREVRRGRTDPRGRPRHRLHAGRRGLPALLRQGPLQARGL